VILHLNETVDGRPTADGHWVFIVGKNGNDWTLFDPGWSHASRIGSDVDEPELLTSLNAHLVGFVSAGHRRTFTVSQVRTYKQGALPTAGLCVHAHSPVELTLIDPAGRRLGWNGVTASDDFEISEGSYLRDIPIADDNRDGPSEGDPTGIKTAFVPSTVSGSYQVEVTGTAPGNYTLEFEITVPGGASKLNTVSGATDVGVKSNYSIIFPVVGTSTDLAVSQIASPTSVGIGENLTLTISISNGAPTTATPVAATSMAVRI
jgi:hypothetical protein